jgi:hypothetical protein
MQYDDQLGSTVLNQIRSLPFWSDFENRVAVAITGSVGAGMGDVHSDLDVYILVPEKDSIPLYENYKKGYEEGTIDVLNPRAFQFDEFPMVRLKEVDGHHRAMVFESIEENVRNYNDVDRWVWRHCIPLHDPKGRLESLRAECAEYPPHILNRKLIRHYWLMCDNIFSTKKPLERGQRETVSLLCLQGISHLLKFCILAEGKPYPYDKWLYRVAIETKLGNLVREYVDAIFEEIHRKDIVYEEPVAYVKPGHRNEQYENYRIYHLLSAMMKVLEGKMPELEKDWHALSDRIGAWKPR